MSRLIYTRTYKNNSLSSQKSTSIMSWIHCWFFFFFFFYFVLPSTIKFLSISFNLLSLFVSFLIYIYIYIYIYILIHVSLNVWWLFIYNFLKRTCSNLRKSSFSILVAFFIMVNNSHFITNFFIFKFSDTTVSIVRTRR